MQLSKPAETHSDVREAIKGLSAKPPTLTGMLFAREHNTEKPLDLDTAKRIAEQRLKVGRFSHV